MKKTLYTLVILLAITVSSCRENKPENLEVETTLQTIDNVEENLDQTNEELMNTSKETEEALMALDSLNN
ncbi:hypothetical protein [uncultured Dokdonia sp.]|uniref:hypothetical protein n=1 Tax=unclassified Dokdonia TaxID=2615033 RepID=UPI00260E0C17|nr:hypothetical protein [uncultured Dokdonia sp.]